MMLLHELKERIVEEYDPDDIVEALELSTEDLLDAFEDRLLKNIHKFEGELDESD